MRWAWELDLLVLAVVLAPVWVLWLLNAIDNWVGDVPNPLYGSTDRPPPNWRDRQ
jgi:hypothetical protein